MKTKKENKKAVAENKKAVAENKKAVAENKKAVAENKKTKVSSDEFLKICSESDKELKELEKIYEVDFSKIPDKKVETVKAENSKKENKTTKTVFEFLESKKAEFKSLNEKIRFGNLMQNDASLKMIMTDKNFCTKEQIDFNISKFSEIELTNKGTVREKSLNLFRVSEVLIFSLAKNQILSVLTETEKNEFEFIALEKSFYIVNKVKKTGKEILNFRKESDKLRALKNAYYMNISNVLLNTKEFFNAWKKELSSESEN